MGSPARGPRQRAARSGEAALLELGGGLAELTTPASRRSVFHGQKGRPPRARSLAPPSAAPFSAWAAPGRWPTTDSGRPDRERPSRNREPFPGWTESAPAVAPGPALARRSGPLTGEVPMSLLGLEVRSALRRIARAPAFSAGVVVTLALCIGANAILATSIEGVLLRALPFHHPARLVWIWSTGTDRDRAFFSLPNLEDVRTLIPGTPSSASPPGGEPHRPGAAGPHHRYQGLRPAGNAAARAPALGRMLEPADDDPGRPPVVVIGHRLWADRFGRSPSVLGSTPTIVVGTPSRVSVAPSTDGDRPNRSAQRRWPMTTTGGRPGSSSAGSSIRPRAGDTPSSVPRPPEALIPVIRTAAPGR